MCVFLAALSDILWCDSVQCVCIAHHHHHAMHLCASFFVHFFRILWNAFYAIFFLFNLNPMFYVRVYLLERVCVWLLACLLASLPRTWFLLTRQRVWAFELFESYSINRSDQVHCVIKFTTYRSEIGSQQTQNHVSSSAKTRFISYAIEWVEIVVK